MYEEHWGPGRAAIIALRYICRSAQNGSVTVRKTEPSVPDKGDWNSYGKSEPEDGPRSAMSGWIIRCWDAMTAEQLAI
jgi:hypothetical protein